MKSSKNLARKFITFRNISPSNLVKIQQQLNSVNIKIVNCLQKRKPDKLTSRMIGILELIFPKLYGMWFL